MTYFAVLLKSPEMLRSPAIAQVLARFLAIPSPDATQKAMSGWGIVADKLDELKARQLSDQLQAAGVSNIIIRSQALILPAAPQNVGAMVMTPQKIQLSLRKGGTIEMTPEAVSLIAAAGFDEETFKKVKVHEGPTTGERLASAGILIATGLPIKFGKKSQDVEKTLHSTETHYFMDLCQKQPPQRFRIDAQAFDYSCLKERKQFNALGNFKVLVSDLLKWAPKSPVNLGGRVFAANKPLHEAGYRSMVDFEREMAWQLTLNEINEKKI